MYSKPHDLTPSAMSSNTNASPAILIRSHPAPRDSGVKGKLEFSNTVTIRQDLWDKLPFAASNISSILGMPLKLARYPDSANYNAQPNMLPFFTETDPTDTVKFGKVRLNRLQGTIVVANLHGGDMDRQKLIGLIQYLGGPVLRAIKEYRVVGPGPEQLRAKAKEVKESVMTKAAFEAWVAAGGAVADAGGQVDGTEFGEILGGEKGEESGEE